MNNLLKISGILAMIAFTFASVCAGLFLLSVKRTSDGMPEFMERTSTEYRTLIALEMDATRQEILDTINKNAGSGIGEVSATRRDAVALLAKIDQRAVELAAAIDKRASQAVEVSHRFMLAGGFTAMDEYKKTNEALRATLAIADRQLAMGDNFAPYMNCKGNGACIPAQTVALLGSSRSTVGTLARELPKISLSFEKSAESAERTMLTNEKTARNIADLTTPMKPWIKWVLRGATVAVPIIGVVK